MLIFIQISTHYIVTLLQGIIILVARYYSVNMKFRETTYFIGNLNYRYQNCCEWQHRLKQQYLVEIPDTNVHVVTLSNQKIFLPKS